MTITYPIDFPTDVGLTDAVLRIRTSNARSQSPFTLSEQIYSWAGQRWEIEAQLPRMKRAEAEIYHCFLAKLKGRQGTFTMYVPSGKSPRGVYEQTSTDNLLTEAGDHLRTESNDNIVIEFGSSIVVKGGSQTGNTLVVDGFGANQTNVLRCGDFFQLGTGSNTRLYKILNDVNSDAAGSATLDIFPNLRSSPDDNEALILDNPKGLFRLATNEVDMPSDFINTFTVSFTAVEAIDGT
jgi:hypothetical protein